MILKSLFIILALVFHFIPRNEHIWLTGKCNAWLDNMTPPSFFDNSKYFYLYLVDHTKEKVYWISSSKKEIDLLKEYHLPVVKFRSIKGIYLILRAKYFFHHYGTDQIERKLQHGSTQLNFWHGIPLKKIRYDVIPNEKRNPKGIIKFMDKKSAEYVSSSSKYLSETIFSHAFDVPSERLLNYGYPRTDILRLDKKGTIDFCKKYSKELLPYITELKKYKKVFLYMPTWRDNDPYYFKKADIDFLKLSKQLEKLNAIFFIKLHPLTPFIKSDEYRNIIQLDNDIDIYPLLIFVDILITDYSSIYFDFLLHDREIIFIPYDYDEYVKSRELYYEYDDITPGIKYNSFSDFIDSIQEIEKLDYHIERRMIREKFIDDYDYNACKKIYEYFTDVDFTQK